MLTRLRPRLTLSAAGAAATTSCAERVSFVPSSRPSSSSSTRSVPVDDLCLPLSCPYSLESIAPPPSSQVVVNEATLDKLHRLSALVRPSSQEDDYLEGFDELVSIVDRVKLVDTSSIGPGMVDARIRALPPRPAPAPPSSSRPPPIETKRERQQQQREQEEEEEDEPEERLTMISGERLLQGAKATRGRFFVARIPDNVRTRNNNNKPDNTADQQ
ncbi:hypothetical protein JCM3766R1_001468 [Sporobolomyces carnicolor]